MFQSKKMLCFPFKLFLHDDHNDDDDDYDEDDSKLIVICAGR